MHICAENRVEMLIPAQCKKKKANRFLQRNDVQMNNVPRGFYFKSSIFVCAKYILFAKYTKLRRKKMLTKRKMGIPLSKNPVVSSVFSSRQLLHACIIKHSTVDYQTKPATKILCMQRIDKPYLGVDQVICCCYYAF